ncbi:MAG TPA: hypothetical protein G4N92_02255 [Anaerolineae bacterium]|nr:hypothetical protein [Anaerolineae bacterium]
MKGFLTKSLFVIFAALAGYTVITGGFFSNHNEPFLGFNPNVHLQGTESLNAQLDELDEMGVKLIKVNIPWNKVELSPGIFSWSYTTNGVHHDLNYLLLEADKRNMKVVAILSGGPFYLDNQIPDQPVNPESLLESWRRYVQATVDAFGKQIQYWQIGEKINTPKGWGKVLFPADQDAFAQPDAVLYAQMLKSAYTIIKAKQAGDMIILGGLVSDTDSCITQPTAFLQHIYNTGEWDSFDLIGLDIKTQAFPPETLLHYQIFDPLTEMCLYSAEGGFNLMDQVRLVEMTSAQYGEKPIWITELGWAESNLVELTDEHGAIPDVIHADYLSRATIMFLAEPEVQKVFWNLCIDNFNTDSYKIKLFTKNAFNNLNHILNVTGSISDYSDKALNQYEYRFRSNGKLGIVLWRSIGADALEATTISDLHGYDLKAYSVDAESISWKSGITLPVDAQGQTTLLLSERPVFIQGKPEDLKSAVLGAIKDIGSSIGKFAKAKLNEWIHVQKIKAAQGISDWVGEQQQSLLEMIKESFKEWLLESLKIAKN